MSDEVHDLRDALAALRDRDEQLALAQRAAGLGVSSLDLATGVGITTPEWRDVVGMPGPPAPQDFPTFLARVHPDDRDRVAALHAGPPGPGGLDFEFRVNHPARGERWVLSRSRLLPVAGGPGRLVGIALDVTDRKRAEDALRQARDDLEARVAERTAELARANDALRAEVAERERGVATRTDLLRALTTAQEDERRRVARDLHDSVGQLLAGLSLAVEAVAAGPLPAAATARLADVRRAADELGRQVHGLAARLRPTALDDLGLEAALAQLAAEWSSRTGVPVDLHTAGLEAGRLPPGVETVLYRVVQEALTNVAKHARAKQVSVVVSRFDGEAVAVVEDDGCGFDPEAAGRGRFGLVGMRERAALAGGELDVESRPGAGTAVIARVPVREDGRG